MSRSQNQLNTACSLLERYRAGEPFHLYLKQYFATARKHGSTDRRILRDLCYAYFRIGHLWKEMDLPERILAAYYVVHPTPPIFLQDLRPDWPVTNSVDPVERAGLIGLEASATELFPYADELSPEIDSNAYAFSLLKQPDLFIRIRPGYSTAVLQRLQQDGIAHRPIGPHAVAIENSTALESRFQLDEEVVVQDLSSQRIAELISAQPNRPTWRVWDACAASGGKSLLLHDCLGSVELTCTDLRPSILNNLSRRLGKAGVPVKCIQADDLSQKRDRSQRGTFDLIVADVPCSGSGTWARTPEQLFSFERSSLLSYASRQQQILSNLIPSLAPGGFLLYITCSVFEQENAAQIKWLSANHSLSVVLERSFIGIHERADTLFAALLQRSE